MVAFVFSILALTSPEWASRNSYDPLQKPKNWTDANLVYTLQRSPFKICSANPHDMTVNSTTGSDPVTITTYTVDCEQFRPFGFDQTSCELEVATKANNVSNIGDARQCQQIHYAGNFEIASTVCVTLGFALASIAMLLTIVSVGPGEPGTSEGEGNGTDHHHQHDHHHDRHHHKHGRPHVFFAPYLNLLLVTTLCVGVITAVISQFYAIEGLIQSAVNNGDFTTSAGTSETDHGPWYQGKALSVYMTCSWGFAAGGAAMAAQTWRLPRWEKLI